MHANISALCTMMFLWFCLLASVQVGKCSPFDVSAAPDPALKAGSKDYYYTTASRDKDIGIYNLRATAGNPLKGLVADPGFSNFDPDATGIDASLDHYYLGLKEVLVADPDVVGLKSAFDWTALEDRLEASKARRRHAVLTFQVHYPGKPLQATVPKYLLDKNITRHFYAEFEGGGLSPDYGDPLLLWALQQFVEQFGAKYDGDLRIGFINLGLLGFWGEWQTIPYDWVPQRSKQMLTEWYAAAFSQTHLLARSPFEPAYKAGFGYNDGSFAYHTLDFDANGGVNSSNYFWPSIQKADHDDFWKRAPMAGETWPELQPIVFEPSYPAGTYQHQDIIRCIYTTHATYIQHQEAFINGGYRGEEFDRANDAHSLLGYSFLIEQVALAGSPTLPGSVDIDVTVQKGGVAPFYYALSLALSCNGTTTIVEGVESMIEAGEFKVFSFDGIPATTECLDKVSFTLQSPYSIEGRPIKFAQGYDGEVSLSLPIPVNALAQTENTPDEGGPGLVFGFTLVRVHEDDSWSVVQPLHNNDVVDLSRVGRNMSIRADMIGAVDKVDFWYNGGFWRTEQKPPFAMGGNRGDAINIVFDLGQPGTKTVTAIAYNEAGGVSGNRTVTFSVLEAVDASSQIYNPVLPDPATITAHFTEAPSAQAASTASPTGQSGVPVPSPMASGATNMPASSPEATDAAPTSDNNGEPYDPISSAPTSGNVDDVQDFNTPSTPDTVDLIDEMTNQLQPKKGEDDKDGNPKLTAIIVGTLAATAVIVSLALYRIWRGKVLLVKRNNLEEDTEDTDSQEATDQSSQGRGNNFPLIDMEAPVRPQY